MKDTIAIEVIRAHDLLGLAMERAHTDSALESLLAATEDRLRAIARLVGLDPVDDLGIDRPAAEARAEAQVTS